MRKQSTIRECTESKNTKITRKNSRKETKKELITRLWGISKTKKLS